MQLSFEAFDKAICIVESGDNPDVPLGDGGRALGRRQMHPDFMDQWYRPPRGSEDTWDQAEGRALLAFYQTAVRLGSDDVAAAVGYHLHGQPHAGEADIMGPGADYARRFREAAGL